MSSLFTASTTPFSSTVASFDWSTLSGKCLTAAVCALGWWLTLPPPAHARRVGIWPFATTLSTRPLPDLSPFASEQSRLFVRAAANDDLRFCYQNQFETYYSPSLAHGVIKASGTFESCEGRRQAKTVRFVEEDEVLLVNSWIIPGLHQHQKASTPYDVEEKELDDQEVSAQPKPEPVVKRHVHFDDYNSYLDVENYLEPDAHNQLSFPRTTYPREVPDFEVDDGDGDIAMEDFDAPGTLASIESLVDAFALLSLD